METAQAVRTVTLRALMLGACVSSTGGVAQEVASESSPLQEVVVVGSQIKGATTTAALPVTTEATFRNAHVAGAYTA